MSAWSDEFDAITTRPERSMCNAIHAWSIETQKGINARGPTSLCQKMTHATKIAFALFANSSNKENRTVSRDSLVLNSLGQRDQSHEPAAVISNSGCEQSAVALRDCKIRVP